MARAEPLTVEGVRCHLKSEWIGQHIYLFGTLPAANTTLRQLAQDGVGHGTVVLAEGQSAARSGTGAVWFSPSALNLYLAIVLRPKLAPHDLLAFSAIPALALVEALFIEGVAARLRWPNEIVVDGRKVGGAAVESSTTGDRVDHVIFVFDVNLNVDRSSLGEALGERALGATSVLEETGHEVDRNRFAGALLTLVDKWVGIWDNLGREAVLTARRELETHG